MNNNSMRSVLRKLGKTVTEKYLRKLLGVCLCHDNALAYSYWQIRAI